MSNLPRPSTPEATARYWTVGRCNRFAVSLTLMVLAGWDFWRGQYVLAVLLLIAAKGMTEWERSIQQREGWR